MRTTEHSDFKSRPSWETVSPKFREVVLVSNALPEKFPEANKKETRRQDSGIDKEREASQEALMGSLDEREKTLFQNYLKQKHDYFVALARRYYPLVRFFRNQGMLGIENRGWQAVARHSLVMSELAGNLAQALNKSGVEVNPNELRVAGLIHDMVKRFEMEHFRTLQSKNADREEGQRVSEEQIYKQMADFGDNQFADLVNNESFKSEIVSMLPELQAPDRFEEFIRFIRNIGEVGSMEMVSKGFDPESSPLESSELLENNISKILFYLDQIIKHTAIVSVQERFADARKRYASPKSQQSAQFKQMDNRETIALRIQREFTARLGIGQEEVAQYLAKLFFEKLNQGI